MSQSFLSRRDFLRIAGMGAAAAALPLSRIRAEAQERKPNVIVILADDQGFNDVGFNGCPDVATPNIDSIAAAGTRFSNGYVSCPVCSPTRAGLMTGRYQQRFGHEGNPTRQTETSIKWGLPVNQKTVADYMKEQGYATGVVGKWHLGDDVQFHPNRRGFDEFFGFIGGAHPYLDPTLKSFNTIQRNGEPYDERGYLTDAFGRESAAFIRRHKDEPFFLYVSFNAPHAPLQVRPGSEDEFAEIEDPRRRLFAGMLKSMDEAIGKVLSAVRANGLEEDTLIFYLSDNGGPTPGNTSRNDPFKGYKTQVHEGGVHVPFAVQWKGHIPAGRVLSQPVISLDILPTSVAVAGGKAGANVDGADLMPLLTGATRERPHEALYWRFDTQSAIRHGDWKMSRHEDLGTRLHNLAVDPWEEENLAAENPAKVRELQAAWDKWNALNVEPLWPAKRDAPWTDETW